MEIAKKTNGSLHGAKDGRWEWRISEATKLFDHDQQRWLDQYNYGSHETDVQAKKYNYNASEIAQASQQLSPKGESL